MNNSDKIFGTAEQKDKNKDLEVCHIDDKEVDIDTDITEIDSEDRSLKDLIGKTIKDVKLSGNKETITFITAQDEAIKYKAYAECCSDSWIEHVEDLDNLIGNTISKIVIKTLDNTIEYKAKDECSRGFIQVYSYEFVTNKGICAVEFRNDSNGYYGGWLERVED